MLLTIGDVEWGIALTIWVATVTLYISKLISKITTTYIARKVIHMLGGGVVAVLAPFVFTSPLVPIIASYVLMAYLIFHRAKKNYLNWFQDEGNRGEVYYTFSFGTLLLIMEFLDHDYWLTKDVFIPLLPIYYMSFGDGVTGIIRNYVYKRRVKGFWGSVGMAIVCVPLGYYFFGIYGAISGVIATLVEIAPFLDDNIGVPFISFAFLYLAIKVF